jgi:amino acid adenylation domain-containing protein/thioester reductase-like protein
VNWENIENFYPLSPIQQGILFHTLYAPESGVYFNQTLCTLHGNLNVSTFEQAWQQVVDRHSVLRTSFVWKSIKEPVQIVHRQVKLPCIQHDWQKLSAQEQQERLETLLQAERKQGFELNKAPLMRLTIIQLAFDTYQFVWSHHHLLLDGWSSALILKEVIAFYEAYCLGQELHLELSRPYRDYIAWLHQQELSNAEAFWRQMLTSVQAPTPLVVDRISEKFGSQEKSYAQQQIKLSMESTAALRSLAQKHQLTLNTILQGTWALLLSCYSGETNVVFGATVSGRPAALAGAESMVGLFINTLPVRVRVDAEDLLLSWLKRLQTQQIEARQYEYSPLSQIQDWSDVPRSMPLFESIVVFENYPVEASLLECSDELKIRNIRSVERTNYPLTVVVVPSSELLLEISYDSRRFDAMTITRMLGHLQTLLEGTISNPERRVSELSILSEGERLQLLGECNNTQVQYPQNQCIHQLFEAQVQHSPHAVAIVFEDEQLTYQQLNARANQLAHHLRSLGVRPEVLVGIYMERSVEMVVGLLAILKAGGAYVPLDSKYPKERLAFILQDAQIPVLLTQQPLIETLPKHQTRVVCLDTDWGSIAQNSQENLVSNSTANNLVYVIYTSGSTGQPKGVLVNHVNVTRLFYAVQSWYHFNEKDIWTLFHSIAFDFSVWEVWGALLFGGRLVVVPYWLSRSPEAFYDLLCKQQVTVLNQTPSAFRQLIRAEESLGTAKELALRLVIFGGEALELQSLKPWFERHGDRSPQLVNMYGITETTVHVTYRPLTMADLEVASGSLIGRPIPDLQVYLLAPNQQPVPIGVPGEMYIGGAGLARGYLNRPELTAIKFIANSFSNKPDARLYSSGDLARYLPNGDIEYLGRIDHQVKIRGFRIELEEIEAVLAQHPGVQETVVLAREVQPGDKQLVAYVVPSKQQTLTTSQLRNFLKQQLPEYMVPPVFVFLDALPLTPNGKVDRQALPNSNATRPELDEAFVAPRTPEEKVLAEIWNQVLGLEQVGIYDNFFALGGDSIRSIQVQSQAQERGLCFSLQQLFKYQTIYELVQNLTEQEAGTIISQKVQPFSLICEQDRLKLPNDIEDAYPLTQLQMGMVFHSEYNLDTPTYHNVSSYHLQAPFNLQYFQTAVQQLADRHPVLRTSFEMSKFNEPLQLVHKMVNVPLQIEDIRHLSFAQQEKVLSNWFEAEKQSLFDWTKAPLLRFHIHRRSEETFQFSFTEHHAILDGWSVASMLTELFVQYFSLLNKEADLLPSPPAVNFKDFVALEQEAIALDAQERYWTEKLSDSTLTMLPRWSAANHRNSVQQVGVYEVPLSIEVSQGLLQLAKSLKVSLKSVLLAAHMRVLSLLSGQSDIVTGLVSHGRLEGTDGERVLGLFLNSLPFRLQCNGGTWIDLVRNTFEAEQELLPFRRYPLAELQRVLGRQSLFEIAFNFVHFHVYQNTLNLKGVQVLDTKTFEKTNFTLTAQFSQNPSSSEVHFSLNYDPIALCEEQIKQIGDYYARTLTAIASEPEERYESYCLLSQQEQYQLLVEWSNTKTDYPINQCIHQLFEAQVQQNSNAVAVVFEDEQLTYSELNHRANQLAHHLQTLGVGPEVLVGICLKRSIEMIIGLLGILKAGGAYLPLDPTYPKERLAFMLENTQVPVLLTEHHWIDILPPHQAQVICLDTDWKTNADDPALQYAQQRQSNPVSGVTTKNLAYVIYTSGSTGKPKGVMNTHMGLCNRLLWMQDAYQLTETDRVLQKTPFSFDVSIWEFFWPLLNGARLIIAQPGGHQDNAYLVKLIAKEQITTLHFVPSMLQAFLEEPGLEACHCLKRVICSGEVLPFELQKRFFTRLNAQLHNLYGPTEATIDVTFWDCKRQSNLSIIPIGRPIANTQIYLLDNYQEPVPIGVPGEVHIGGLGLARGYLNHPELTAQKFIPNPFTDEPSAHLYKTGDLARYLSDGNIEFLGRIDHQVKVRGFRIELGEIEAVLAQHPDVLQTVVIAREDNSNDKSLVAYVIPKVEKVLTSSELRRFLKEKLPDYMIPSVFVMVEALPLTPNGKVDRRALPAPDQNRSNLEQVYVAPRTPVEELLARMWTQVLKVEQVGIYDNFFDLGGHSLLITQLVVRLRETFQIELSLRSLFEMPTVAQLAQSIEIAQKTGASTIGTKNVVDLNNEAILDPTICPLAIPIQFTTEPACIFLTGTTGFVGAFLLNELLQQTHADIYCLVRASNAEEGKKRIQSSLESYLLWDKSQSPRIIPVVGDLSEPLLGFSQEQFREMAELIDVVYHNGAWVHHTSPYSVLKAANVLGTQEVLRLASQFKVKPVHFISTKSVFSSVGDSGVKVVREQDSLDNYQLPSGGYAQSKWVAEKLVTIARDRGLPVCIYRLGRVSGHSQTGVFNTNDFLYKLIIGCTQLGSVPDVEMIEDMTPVDYISRAIVHLSRQEKSLGKAFHFVNHQPFYSSMLSNLLSSLGYPIQQISYKQWRSKLLEVAERSPENTLYPLVPFFLAQDYEENISHSGRLQFNYQNTLDGLADTSIVCPAIDSQLFSTYFSYLIHNGFLKPLQPNDERENFG